MIGLRARFLLLSGMVVVATAAAGYVGVYTFARVSAVVGERVNDSAAAIALVEKMESALEDESEARAEFDETRAAEARREFDETFVRLPPVMDSAEEATERDAAARLRGHVDAFRTKGDAREMRGALAACALLRHLHFDSTQRAASWARDEAQKATRTVSLLSCMALLFAIAVAWRLGRRIIWPLRQVSTAVKELRQSDHAPLSKSGVRARFSADRELERLYSNVHEIARLDEMKSELLAVASHELKTPLTTLRMTLGLLGEKAASLSPQQCDLVRTAQDGVTQLGATVDEFLDLTRIEAGTLHLTSASVDLAWVAHDVVSTLAPRFDEVGVTLGTDVEPAIVCGDERRLRMVIANLLINALKYAPPGSTVSLSVDAEGSEVTLSVSDEGRGVAPEYRERIFEKFFRVEHVDPNADQGIRGVGIGLYLCRQILAAHRGSIVCDANGTAGARFVLTLPAACDVAATDYGSRSPEGLRLSM